MVTGKKSKKITPQRIFKISWAATETMVLTTAAQLDLFTLIAQGKQTAKELARATKSNLSALERLLNALVGLELLSKADGKYSLMPDTEMFLVQGKPTYMGAMVKGGPRIMEAWRHLPEAVQSGKPVMKVNTQQHGEIFFSELVKQLFPRNFAISAGVAAGLKKRGRKFERILDVAAGSACWSLGFALHYPEAKLTAVDFPAVLNVTRDFVAQQGASERYDYLAGDLAELSFGKNQYDLIILGHICHSEGEKRTRQLIKKSAQALRPGGSLLIAEMLPNDDRSGPPFPLLFALNMLLFTDQGDVFTIAEFRQWTASAGLKQFDVIDSELSDSPLLLATK